MSNPFLSESFELENVSSIKKHSNLLECRFTISNTVRVNNDCFEKHPPILFLFSNNQAHYTVHHSRTLIKLSDTSNKYKSSMGIGKLLKITKQTLSHLEYKIISFHSPQVAHCFHNTFHTQNCK